MKSVILVRHAKAMDRDKARALGVPEPMRPLTEKGIAEFERHVWRTSELFAGTELFVASPYRRAAATLDLLRQGLKPPAGEAGRIKMLTSSLIEPHSDPEKFLRWLKKRKESRIVAVSHEPFMSDFLSLATGTETSFIKIKKGAVLILRTRDDGQGFRLTQLVQPL